MYLNVNALGDRQGLTSEGHCGSPCGMEEIIREHLRGKRVSDKYDQLFDHTESFKPRGTGNKKPNKPCLSDRALDEVMGFQGSESLAVDDGRSSVTLNVDSGFRTVNIFALAEANLLVAQSGDAFRNGFEIELIS